MNLDETLYRDINDFARNTPWLHGVLAAYALWAGLVALVLLVIAGWWHARARADAPRAVGISVLTGVAALVALLVNQQLISPAIARPRPCAVLDGVEVLLSCNADYSMPSDHCIIAGAITAGLWLLDRRLGVIATILALLLAFGRVYVGVHYPSDAAVGLLVGAAIGLIVIFALRVPTALLFQRLTRSPVRPLVQSHS
ncbi:phosphatase PAP2 family protein [Luteimicrobium sp. DT211]|uniref:phosphatase PAP2 family protein n=1 Tax=Luteimicrobium sp. DT211 TaxID=3393412 RepID=UPI003CFB4BE3